MWILYEFCRMGIIALNNTILLIISDALILDVLY